MVQLYYPGGPSYRSSNPAIKIAQETEWAWWLIAGLAKADCVAAYQPKGAGSQSASYVNLNDPGVKDANPVVAPTWSASVGWTFNGTTQYLDTGIDPESGYSVICRFNNGTGTDQVIFGRERSTGDSFVIVPKTAANTKLYRYGSTVGTSFSPGVTTGVIAFAGGTAYYNGSSLGSIVGGGTLNAAPTDTIYIGARNSSGTVNAFWLGDISAIAIYSSTLTATQVSALTTAMNLL